MPGPTLTASATQTTPIKSESKQEIASSEQNGVTEMPSGFRPVKMFSSSAIPETAETSVPGTSEGATTTVGGDFSPSSPSDMSLVDAGKCYLTTPPTPEDRKYWTLPRAHLQKEMTTKDEEELVSKLTREGATQVITDKEPPSNARLVLESPSTKYYTLPTSHAESRTMSLPPPPKFEGIGPVNEDGVPLSLRTVSISL